MLGAPLHIRTGAMASLAPWLNAALGSAVRIAAPPRAHARIVCSDFGHDIVSVAPSPCTARTGGQSRVEFFRAISFAEALGGGKGFAIARRAASSSSSWVEEDEALAEEAALEAGLAEAGLDEGSPEGSSNGGQSKEDIVKEVMQRLSEEDLEETAKLYNYEEELFSQIDFAQINAFTNKPFSGNPAAVCYLPYQRDDEWLQLIAREFNLPATAFVVKRRILKKKMVVEDDDSPELDSDDVDDEEKPTISPIENEFDIRWFTTTSELTLCGHASLASAHMLFSSGLVEGDTIIFHHKTGTLKARKISGYDEQLTRDQGDEGQDDSEARPKSKVELGKGVVELEFPLSKVSKIDSGETQVVLDALGGAEVLWVGRTPLGDYLVELPSSKHVEKLEPRLDKMVNFDGRGGVIVTARAPDDSKFDFISRFFVPKQGISEDPVTGSIHCTLGPYWSTKLEKNYLQAYQASPRGGELSVRVDFAGDCVYLQGGAVLLMAGTLLNTFRT